LADSGGEKTVKDCTISARAVKISPIFRVASSLRKRFA